MRHHTARLPLHSAQPTRSDGIVIRLAEQLLFLSMILVNPWGDIARCTARILRHRLRHVNEITRDICRIRKMHVGNFRDQLVHTDGTNMTRPVSSIHHRRAVIAAYHAYHPFIIAASKTSVETLGHTPILSLLAHVGGKGNDRFAIRTADERMLRTADAHQSVLSFIDAHGIRPTLIVLDINEPAVGFAILINTEKNAVDIRVNQVSVWVDAVQAPETQHVQIRHVGNDAREQLLTALTRAHVHLVETARVQTDARITEQTVLLTCSGDAFVMILLPQRRGVSAGVLQDEPISFIIGLSDRDCGNLEGLRDLINRMSDFHMPCLLFLPFKVDGFGSVHLTEHGDNQLDADNDEEHTAAEQPEVSEQIIIQRMSARIEDHVESESDQQAAGAGTDRKNYAYANLVDSWLRNGVGHRHHNKEDAEQPRAGIFGDD